MIKEEKTVREAIGFALEAGADSVRITLDCSREDYVCTLDGEVDKITRCEDATLTVSIFALGRFGTFSTDKTDPEALKDFFRRAVATV